MAMHAQIKEPAVRRALDTIAWATIFAGCLALAGMAAVQAWQVFARYVLNDSPGWTEPVALLLLNTVMMLGAAIGVRMASHFRFGMVVLLMPPSIQRVVLALMNALIAAIGVLLAWWGARLTADGWDVAMAGTALPQGAMLLPLCIGGVLMALFALERIVTGAPQTMISEED